MFNAFLNFLSLEDNVLYEFLVEFLGDRCEQWHRNNLSIKSFYFLRGGGKVGREKKA